MTKTFTCPPLCGVGIGPRGQPVEWGVVEYVQDVLLPGALGTVDLCDATLRILKALPPRGPEQVGKAVELDKDDWNVLRGLAAQQRNPGSVESLMAFAICNRAILLAQEIPNAEKP